MIAWLLAAALSLSVSPQVTFSPATLKARVRVPGTDDGVALVVVLSSATFYQSSEYPFQPTGRQQTVTLPDWTRVPAGDYEAVVALVDRQGRIVASDRISVHIAEGLPQ